MTFEKSLKTRRESWKYLRVIIPSSGYRKGRGPEVDTCLVCPPMVQSQWGWSGTRKKEGGAGAGQRDMQSRSLRALEANEVFLLWVEGHFLL